MSLLEKQQNKLKELNNKFNDLLMNYPAKGHGGTPFILDNTKGRAMYKAAQKREERLQSLDRQIKEQQEKIDRTERRIVRRNTQTKKSVKFLEKNPIHPLLFELEKEGKVKQWKRNPEYFFVNRLKKVALRTVDGTIKVSARFPLTSQDDVDLCKGLFKEIKERSMQ